MKKTFVLLTMASGLILFSCKNSTPTVATVTTDIPSETGQVQPSEIHKYQIKSGIVTFETDIVGMKGKTILYFDNYGSLELEEKYSDGILKEADLCDGTNRYTINFKKKSAYSMRNCARGIAYKFDWSEISDADKKEKAKKLPNLILAGKNCESYSYTASGITTVFAGWNNITMMQEQKNQYGGSFSHAVSIEENPVIPAEKFTVPAGITVQPGI